MLSCIFVLNLIGIIIIKFIGKTYIQLVKKFSLFISFIILVLSCCLFIKFNSFNGSFQYVTNYSIDTWFFNFSYSFGLDGISIFFFVLSSFLIFLCILFIWDENRFQEYVINLLLIELFLLLIFTSLNILFFYVFFEGILVPMFIIIGLFGSRERKIRALYLFFFYTLCSSLLMLISILYIYEKIGSLNFELISAYNFSYSEQLFLWCSFFLSFASKIPMFPFHIWLPEAHVEAPTVGSVLLAGILLKLGVYGFLRFSISIFYNASITFLPIIYFLSIIGILYASLTALRQTDLKRIIAYSSIAHMNLVTLGVFSFNVIGIEGSILQSISHGFVSGGLFFLIGILYNRYHSRFLYYYGGLVYFTPVLSTIFLLLTFANIAVPGTSSFIGEFLLLTGVYKLNSIIGSVSALGVILCGSYSLWLYNKMIFGNIKVTFTKKYLDINYREFFIMISLIFFIFLMGLFSTIFTEYLHSSCSLLYSLFVY